METPAERDVKELEGVQVYPSTPKARYIKFKGPEKIEYETENIKSVSDLKSIGVELLETPIFGDLINLGDYRETDTFIVMDGGRLLPNPDLGGSGYLTIPYSVCRHFKNCTQKYPDDITVSILLELRRDDKLVLDRVGSLNPAMDVRFSYDSVEDSLYADFPNNDCLSEPDLDVGRIEDHYYNRYSTVRVCCGTPFEKHSTWEGIRQSGGKPLDVDLPKHWQREIGAYGGGDFFDHVSIEFKGPTRYLSDVMQKLVRNAFRFRIFNLDSICNGSPASDVTQNKDYQTKRERKVASIKTLSSSQERVLAVTDKEVLNAFGVVDKSMDLKFYLAKDDATVEVLFPNGDIVGSKQAGASAVAKHYSSPYSRVAVSFRESLSDENESFDLASALLDVPLPDDWWMDAIDHKWNSSNVESKRVTLTGPTDGLDATMRLVMDLPSRFRYLATQVENCPPAHHKKSLDV